MPQAELDRIDRRLLQLLQADGRMSNALLASTVGLSPAACLRRVQRLEDKGFIEGYSARLSAELLGGEQTVYVEITMARQNDAALEAFERAVAAVPEVQECYAVAADFDYLLRVDVTSGSDYERVRRRELAELPHVARMRSIFGLRRVKRHLGPTVRV